MAAITLKKAGKAVLLGSAALIVLVWGAGVAWTASGSDKWELEIDKDGVQVYSYKARGSYLKQFKGVRKADFSRSQLVASLMLDNGSLENCKAWIPVCSKLTVIEPFSQTTQGDAVLWTLELMPPVFSDREFLIKSHAAQDPKTGQVFIDIMADANKVALHDCCVRIRHIHNRWQITPLGDGQVEIQLTQDNSMGGLFPDLLVNLGTADATYKLLHEQLPVLVNKEKYRAARFDFIDESPRVAMAAAR